MVLYASPDVPKLLLYLFLCRHRRHGVSHYENDPHNDQDDSQEDRTVPATLAHPATLAWGGDAFRESNCKI